MKDASSLPALVQPAIALTPAETTRYARHLSLPQMGEEGQRRLRSARVLVVGAGGLGSPIIMYLAAAGIGHITIIDDDVVEPSNLQRQVIHRDCDVDRAKAESARDAVLRLDPSLSISVIVDRLNPDNACDLFSSHDLVLDGADNFATRYLSNDASELTGTPLVWGTIAQFSAQISVFWPAYGPTLRDLYPDIPPVDSVPSCAEGGVLGALVGQTGSLMALEAIKVITGIGTPIIGKLVLLDALHCTQRCLSFNRDPGRMPVTDLHEVTEVCRAAARPPQVSLSDYMGFKPDLLIDVRESAEHASGHIPGDIHIPVGEIEAEGWQAIEQRGIVVQPDTVAVIYCRSGTRSDRAVKTLMADPSAPPAIRWRSLSGGYLAWQAHTDTLSHDGTS